MYVTTPNAGVPPAAGRLGCRRRAAERRLPMKTRRGLAGRGITLPGPERRGARKDKIPPSIRTNKKLADPTVCDHCGAIYTRKTWRFDHPVTRELLAEAEWGICPACEQAERQVGYGKIVLEDYAARADERAIRRRIANVEKRAAYTQPERRVISIDRNGDALEVLTTSQELAHRIAREIEKAFGGRCRYSWSDDGSLYAVWRPAA